MQEGNFSRVMRDRLLTTMGCCFCDHPLIRRTETLPRTQTLDLGVGRSTSTIQTMVHLGTISDKQVRLYLHLLKVARCLKCNLSFMKERIWQTAMRQTSPMTLSSPIVNTSTPRRYRTSNNRLTGTSKATLKVRSPWHPLKTWRARSTYRSRKVVLRQLT